MQGSHLNVLLLIAPLLACGTQTQVLPREVTHYKVPDGEAPQQLSYSYKDRILAFQSGGTRTCEGGMHNPVHRWIGGVVGLN